MLGYWRGGDRPASTRAHGPGARGRLAAHRRPRAARRGREPHLVGRKKDVIIDANGKNVYPDELEDAYRDPDLVKELCVVGLPGRRRGEKVALLVVPDWKDGDRAEVRARLEAHVRARLGASCPSRSA